MIREPIDFAGAFLADHADIAPELTLAQWRQARAREQRAAHEQVRRARRRPWLLRALVTIAHASRRVRHG